MHDAPNQGMSVLLVSRTLKESNCKTAECLAAIPSIFRGKTEQLEHRNCFASHFYFKIRPMHCRLSSKLVEQVVMAVHDDKDNESNYEKEKDEHALL